MHLLARPALIPQLILLLDTSSRCVRHVGSALRLRSVVFSVANSFYLFAFGVLVVLPEFDLFRGGGSSRIPLVFSTFFLIGA